MAMAAIGISFALIFLKVSNEDWVHPDIFHFTSSINQPLPADGYIDQEAGQHE